MSKIRSYGIVIGGTELRSDVEFSSSDAAGAGAGGGTEADVDADADDDVRGIEEDVCR